MRPNSITKRKNKVIYKRFFLFFGIFIVVLLGCVVVFGWQFLKSEKLLSPLGLGSLTTGLTTDKTSVIESFCQAQKLPCQHVTDDNSTITITLDNNAIILLSSQKDLQKQLASLQLTLSSLTIEGKQFKKLDFRFEKPFVTF